ncbi:MULTISPECIES: hypothetical protein [Bacteria]|uniref:Homeodomain-like domain-containing protein n=2 Tax=Bacteria TaxID=2 RepID=A0A1I4UJH7_9BURK|nr:MULTISPECIES: hypothetical protein [Bacteria]SFE69378.1 hypothetical protein SAMN05216506_113172 [Saccharopolyspora kobensis]SFM88910.1 hypothetical protein SAMN02982985_05675 [Rugamonas rubra]
MPRPITAPASTRRSSSARRRHCAAGHWPAEALTPAERERLVAELHDRGLTDREIADHCRMSTFTAGRILDRLGLAPNPSKDTA